MVTFHYYGYEVTATPNLIRIHANEGHPSGE